jgi:hypothetical protein
MPDTAGAVASGESRIRTFLSSLSAGTVVGIAAVVTTASVFAVLRWQAVSTTPAGGFWYENGAFVLPPDATTKLGGPLSEQEVDSIKQISRVELERAFAGLRMTVTQSQDAFWRVAVLQTLARRGQLPHAGEAVGLGPLGGTGAVGFVIVALKAIQYAPSGASRQRMIEGIGRGIGRVAVHEFTHQILGATAGHNDADENSYEYPSPDRASQYYGELHWTIAWPLLQRKIGT